MGLKLSKRMIKIISLCESCKTIVDVGTDHGKVAIYLANMSISDNVLAIDNKKGPLEFCAKNANMYLNDDSAHFEIRLSDGISSLSKTEEYGIIITGIGYDNMINIISNINDYNFKYLILSPHTKVNELIKKLDIFNIDIINEETVFEDNKYYYIIKAKKRGQ